MKVGDLVKHVHYSHSDVLHNEIGIVTRVNHWVDSGAPDRNFGTTVTVLWPQGTHPEDCDESELETVNESR